MYSNYRQPPQHLAWHETMELHELAAFQANHLTAFKMHIVNVKDPQLHSLYAQTNASLEQNLKELLPYYTKAPNAARTSTSAEEDMTAFHAGHLLAFAKTTVRNYAIAITETATPQLRETFQKHLNNAIKLHGDIFQFMYTRGFYPSYQLDQLLAMDVSNAKKAMSR